MKWHTNRAFDWFKFVKAIIKIIDAPFINILSFGNEVVCDTSSAKDINRLSKSKSLRYTYKEKTKSDWK